MLPGHCTPLGRRQPAEPQLAAHPQRDSGRGHHRGRTGHHTPGQHGQQLDRLRSAAVRVIDHHQPPRAGAQRDRRRIQGQRPGLAQQTGDQLVSDAGISQQLCPHPPARAPGDRRHPKPPAAFGRHVGQRRPPGAGRSGHHQYAARPVTRAFEQVFHLRELKTPSDQGHYRTLFRPRRYRGVEPAPPGAGASGSALGRRSGCVGDDQTCSKNSANASARLAASKPQVEHPLQL